MPAPVPGPWGDASYASASTIGTEELGRRAAAASAASTLGNASASTPEQPGTPEGFTIDVAVLNMGMPQETSFSAQPDKVLEASGRHNI